jgi:hypothetical protein
MNIANFFKVLWPIWTIELLLSGIYLLWGPEEVTALSNSLYAISTMALPLLAGLFIVRAGGGIGLAILGGTSISLVSVFAVAVHYFVVSAGFSAFLGFVFATLIFSVGIQAIFGAFGGLLGRKVFRNAI